MATKDKPGQFDCYAAAAPDEPMFILLARDELAPWIVRIWAATRERNPMLRTAAISALDDAMKEKGPHSVDKIEEAYVCAQSMQNWLAAHAILPPPQPPPSPSVSQFVAPYPTTRSRDV